MYKIKTLQIFLHEDIQGRRKIGKNNFDFCFQYDYTFKHEKAPWNPILEF